MLSIKNTSKKVSNTNNTKTKKINSKIEYLQVSYPDVTNIPNVTTMYAQPPNITIQNAKPKLYLITMTDPDAPNGMKLNTSNLIKTKNKTNINHTYTHWVYLQDMRKQNTTEILVPYAPPSPPFGIHRYQFRIYDITNLQQTILDTLKQKNINNINNIPDRNTYYKNNLKKLIKYKINKVIQYKVDSNKL